VKNLTWSLLLIFSLNSYAGSAIPQYCEGHLEGNSLVKIKLESIGNNNFRVQSGMNQGDFIVRRSSLYNNFYEGQGTSYHGIIKNTTIEARLQLPDDSNEMSSFQLFYLTRGDILQSIKYVITCS